MIDWVDGLVIIDGEEFENLRTLVRLIVDPSDGHVKMKDMPHSLKRAVEMVTDLTQAADSCVQVMPNLETIKGGVFTAEQIRRVPFVKQLLKSRDIWSYEVGREYDEFSDTSMK